LILSVIIYYFPLGLFEVCGEGELILEFNSMDFTVFWVLVIEAEIKYAEEGLLTG
jgi:hypothetical protein